MVPKKFHFHFHGFRKRDFVIDVTLTTASHNNVALAERNDFALDNVQNITLCSSVNKVWFCENCYAMNSTAKKFKVRKSMNHNATGWSEEIYCRNTKSWQTKSSVSIWVYILCHSQCFCCCYVNIAGHNN